METGVPSVLVLNYVWRGGTVLTLHDLGDEPVAIEIGVATGSMPARDLLRRDADLRADGEGRCKLRLAACDFEWPGLEAG